MNVLFAWCLFAIALLANLGPAWRFGKTARTRWLAWGLYSAVLISMVVVLLAVGAGTAALRGLVFGATEAAWIVIGSGLFWLAALAGVLLRRRVMED